MQDFKKQFKKGVIELTILRLLYEQDQYGYSIIQQISKRSDNYIEIKDGTLYPILYRLEDNKFIENYWKTDIGSRSKPRKYYKITIAGRLRYEEMLKDYLEINEGIKKILKS
ncbi:MAG: lineage-specific thermal regulator protein [Candidatus Izimaplasma bacterium HR2]|nr:MAG: lineage-specific thermal regulator protein [Candidatus Izimaplasma bacterium HR2]